MDLLKDLGIHLNFEKSNFKPARRQEFLGFTVDTSEELKLTVPYQKKRSIRRAVQGLLKEATKGPVPVRRIARVAGIIQVVLKAVSPTARQDEKEQSYNTSQCLLGKYHLLYIVI
jgi:methionine aminopeptidase